MRRPIKAPIIMRAATGADLRLGVDFGCGNLFGVLIAMAITRRRDRLRMALGRGGRRNDHIVERTGAVAVHVDGCGIKSGAWRTSCRRRCRPRENRFSRRLELRATWLPIDEQGRWPWCRHSRFPLIQPGVSSRGHDLSMEPIFLNDLASRKSAYLAARQTVLATNVANANTPSFKAKDLVGFSDVLSQTQLQIASTDAGHLSVSSVGESGGGLGEKEQDGGFDVTETGNSVGIEQQMMKTGEVNREYALTTSIVKSFHAMLMASLRE